MSHLHILDPFAHLGHVHGAAKPVLLYFDSPWSTRAASKDNHVLLAKSAPGQPGCWEPVLPPQLAARDKLCQPHTSLGCCWPPSGLWWPPPLGLAPSSPRARAQQKSSQKVSLLSERYRRQRRIFALEARCNNKRGFIRKTNMFLLSFLSALEGFLKASFGAGWRVRGRSGGKLCPAPLLLLPPPRNSPFVPILVQ